MDIVFDFLAHAVSLTSPLCNDTRNMLIYTGDWFKFKACAHTHERTYAPTLHR